MMKVFQLFIALCVYLTQSVHSTDPDTHSECGSWAERGECERNASYMTANCASSCVKIAEHAVAEKAALAKIGSFFDLTANDIDGNEIKFDQFSGRVTILTNVASFCGYTENHYHQLVELWSQVKGENVNILAFPCNQFGQQEPGSADEIKAFAKENGVEFTMMSKINVNGPEANLVYKYLKSQTGVDFIKWNFATYFVVAPDGTITEHSGVEPLQLKDFALSLLKDEL